MILLGEVVQILGLAQLDGHAAVADQAVHGRSVDANCSSVKLVGIRCHCWVLCTFVLPNVGIWADPALVRESQTNSLTTRCGF